MVSRGPTGLLGLAMLVVCMVFAVKQNLDRSKAETWPTVQGTIASVRLHDTRQRRHDQIGNTQFIRTDVTYHVSLSYDYEVEGRRYSGNRLAFDIKGSSLDYVQHEMAKYGQGTPVTVHYNPADPADSMVMR